MTIGRNLLHGSLAATVVYGGMYLLFLGRLHNAEARILLEKKQLEDSAFSSELRLDHYVGDKPDRLALQQTHHLPDESKFTKTEVVTMFLYKRKLSYDMPKPGYWDILLEKVQVEDHNNRIRALVRDRLNKELSNYHQVKELLGNRDLAYFTVEKPASEDCRRLYPGTASLFAHELAIRDAAGFGRATSASLREAQRRSAEHGAAYESALAKAKRDLSWTAYRDLERECERSGVYSSGSMIATFEGPNMGRVTYEVPTSAFDAAAFQKILNRTYATMYANNALSTGSQPWAYCYGTSNHCGGSNCSEIVVNCGGSDVIVTIKDRTDQVVRHAYIRAASRYTFHLPNGSYQPFFYYGKGWNPKREMKRVACGMLMGGFVSNESVGKDDQQYLNNTILTYTLVETTFGNFNTMPSNTNEAL